MDRCETVSVSPYKRSERPISCAFKAAGSKPGKRSRQVLELQPVILFRWKKSFHDKIFTIFNIMVIETIKWYLAFPHGDSFHFFSGHLRYLRNLRNGDWQWLKPWGNANIESCIWAGDAQLECFWCVPLTQILHVWCICTYRFTTKLGDFRANVGIYGPYMEHMVIMDGSLVSNAHIRPELQWVISKKC